MTTFDTPGIQRRRPPRAFGETGYTFEPTATVTALECGHETTDGYVPSGAVGKEGTAPVYWCPVHKRWARKAK